MWNAVKIYYLLVTGSLGGLSATNLLKLASLFVLCRALSLSLYVPYAVDQKEGDRPSEDCTSWLCTLDKSYFVKW